jgi:hypothetical protein
MIPIPARNPYGSALGVFCQRPRSLSSAFTLPMGRGHNAKFTSRHSVSEVQSTLDEMALAEQDEFGKVGSVYRWKKHYRFRLGV